MTKEKRYGYIYITKCEITGRRYLGQHNGQQKDLNYFGSGAELKQQVEEHGIENFSSRVVEWTFSAKELFLAECKWMDKTRAVESDEWMNLRHPTAYPKHDASSVQKMLDTRMEKYGTVGVGNSKEAIAKGIATRKRNGTMSSAPEVRRKVRETMLERYGVISLPMSDESKKKQAETKKRNGTNNSTTPESLRQGIETKKRNGTLNSNTVESLARGIETKKRNGTMNGTPEIEAKRKATREKTRVDKFNAIKNPLE